MFITDEIAALFATQSNLIELEENNAELNVVYELLEVKALCDISDVETLFTKVLGEDRLIINVYFDAPGNSSISDISDSSQFFADYNNKITYIEENDEPAKLNIKINKVRAGNKVNVYNIDELVKFWQKDGYVSCLKKIQELKKDVSTLCVYGFQDEIRTNIFSFTKISGSNETELKDDSYKSLKLAKRDKSCHFANSADFHFIPEDFHINGSSNTPESVNALFSKLKLLTSLIFICDFSRFEDERIVFRLNGYRLINKEIFTNTDIEDSCSDEYYQIYEWIYGDGDVIDKVGLARNLISLHLKDNDLISISEGTLQSITSGYQIYLKENVKQYVEIKNKVSESIQSASDKASDIAKNMGSYYRNSIWTMYSFFFSVFLLRTFLKNEGVLVTTDILYFYVAFLILAVIAMIYALNELEQDKARLKGSYESLKNRYKDLLLEEDLEKILDYDKQHIADMKYLDIKKSQYRKLWGGSLGLITIVVLILWLNGAS